MHCDFRRIFKYVITHNNVNLNILYYIPGGIVKMFVYLTRDLHGYILCDLSIYGLKFNFFFIAISTRARRQFSISDRKCVFAVFALLEFKSFPSRRSSKSELGV